MDRDNFESPPTPGCDSDIDSVIALDDIINQESSKRKHNTSSKQSTKTKSSSSSRKHTSESKRPKTNTQHNDTKHNEQESLFNNIKAENSSRHFSDTIREVTAQSSQTQTTKKQTKDASTNTTGVMKIMFGNPASEFRIPDNIQPSTFTITYEL